MRKIFILSFTLILSLTGCSSYTGSKALNEQFNILHHELTNEYWSKSLQQFEEMMAIYKRNEWKLQLLGDEGEYERLHESLNRLKAAIEMQDLQSARLELETVKTIVDDIYSL